jgi:thiamine-monophosphate kinase
VTRHELRSVALGAGAEFDLIRELVARWGDRAKGIGDDAAILDMPRGDKLVASVDASVEGRHFRAEWLTPREIGYRAVTAALSDLAAMAARPLGILLALALPDARREAVSELAQGVAEAVDCAGTGILGGNITAADELCLTTTVLGATFAPLARDGLKPGDYLYVTGRFGGPAAAIGAWTAGRSPAPEYRERFARPTARLNEALWLADRGAIAAIDVSDGLAADVEHLARASDVGVDVDLEVLPMIASLDDPIAAAASGEEYELVVGTRSALEVDAFESRFGIPLTLIGHATSPADGVQFRRGGQRVAKPRGYDHLSR